jgi:hypothetical protein
MIKSGEMVMVGWRLIPAVSMHADTTYHLSGDHLPQKMEMEHQLWSIPDIGL